MVQKPIDPAFNEIDPVFNEDEQGIAALKDDLSECYILHKNLVNENEELRYRLRQILDLATVKDE